MFKSKDWHLSRLSVWIGVSVVTLHVQIHDNIYSPMPFLLSYAIIRDRWLCDSLLQVLAQLVDYSQVM
jgi:hypothetical protein